jgi:glycerol-3-phosphate dehydrogenase
MMPDEVDCLVIGGGITGAGVARDAAMRGLSVLLVESDDFASGTSHLTSKVIHGGLRYLEHGHIRPVIEAIIERHRLLDRLAPNLVKPLKFVIPFEGHHFPKWLVTLCGLQLYGLPEWYRCGRSSMPMLGVRLRRDYPDMRPHPFAITFWDAQASDTRLVMAALRTAEREGALIRNYTAITAARYDDGVWTVTLSCAEGEPSKHGWTIRARTIVNATGPWSPLTAKLLGVEPLPLMWIKGSHIVLRRPPRFGDDALVIRSVRDRRRLWVIPWQNRLIVGTTEREYTDDLRNVRPAPDEVRDLFESFVRFFPTAGVVQGDIQCAYAGVRPIIPQGVESANSLSREHRIEVHRQQRAVTLMGGKLTTFRRMAESAVDEIDRILGRPPPPSRLRSRLRNALMWPDLTPGEARKLRANLTRVFDGTWARPDITCHLVDHYGWDASRILEEAARRPDLGQPLFDGLPYTLAEMSYLCRAEKVVHLIDLVKRRTPIYFLAGGGGLEAIARITKHIAPILGWETKRRAREISAVADEFTADMQACASSNVTLPHEPREIICA